MGKDKVKEMQNDVPGEDRIAQDLQLIQKVYPEADALFSYRLEPVESMKDRCLFTLDTNTLLLPYITSGHSLDAIGKTYKELLRQGRLIVPAQAAREFTKHRPEKLSNLVKTLGDFKSRITLIEDQPYPILEDTERYQQFRGLREQANKLLKQCKDVVGDMVDMVRGWQLNDPVSELYRGLFTKGVVADVPVEEKFIREERERRKTNRIPPGYKDPGVGDLVIWLTILDAGKKHQKPLVFISGEEKADWFYSGDNKTLFPRYELIEEYRMASGGQGFYILNLAELLTLFSAPQKTVDEVKEAQKLLLVQQKLTLAAQINKLVSIVIAANANEDGKLYSSVGPAEIAKGLRSQNLPVEPDMVKLDSNLEETGLFEVTLSLGADREGKPIEPKLKVAVIKPER